MASVGGVIQISLKMSLWEAIKIRMSGIFKNAIAYEQVGNCITIKYKE